MPTASINGLATGLDTSSIIQGLLAIDNQHVTDLQTKQSQVTAEQTAFQTIDAQLLALQAATTPLSLTQNSVFDGLTASSSDPTQVTAAASTGATPGVYSVQVNALATAQEVASQGFSDANAAVTQGTFQIQVGAGAAATVTVDGTNDTLQGLADAINNAGAGVTASVVNDGSGNDPYRLLLTSNQSGADNAIQITNNLAADGGGAVNPVFNSNYVGTAVTSASYNGTSTPTANTGAGGYTGTSNNTYTFTVVNGGTVGTDGGITLSYTDSTGANQGTITLGASDAGVLKNVAQGIQVQLGAGTLVAGQTFSIKAYVPDVQQATNASVTLGSGAGALTVQSDSNQVDNAIPGVTLNLLTANPSQPVTVTVASNTQAAAQDINGFVSAYNDVLQSIDSQSTFDPTTGTAGLLLGNSSSAGIEQQLRGVLGNVVQGVNANLNNLSALGISTGSNGQLTVDQSQLNAVLAGQVPGVSFNDVQRLFGFTATSTNPGIQFVTVGTNTLPSTTVPYQVNVTQAAAHAHITATNALAASTTIDGTDDTFSISVDGQSIGPLTLAHGTYTPQQLAQEVQGEINGSSAADGRQVAVSVSGSRLVVTSASFGRASQATIGTGNALTALGFAGNEAATGQDVAGTFTVNGVVETAVGSGQFLTGASTNANTAGLVVRLDSERRPDSDRRRRLLVERHAGVGFESQHGARRACSTRSLASWKRSTTASRKASLPSRVASPRKTPTSRRNSNPCRRSSRPLRRRSASSKPSAAS